MSVDPNVQGAERTTVGRVIVKRGLVDQDENIDLLEKYYTEMQKSTVETSADNLLDFVTFAHYFGVIVFEGVVGSLDECGDEDAEGEPEEDSEAVPYQPEGAMYPETSTATSPLASTSDSGFSVIEQEREDIDDAAAILSFSSLSEQEKITKWREAFEAMIDEEGDEPIPPSLPTIGVIMEGDNRVLYHEKQSAYLISHVHDPFDTEPRSTMDEDPESFINWPDDMAVDDAPITHDVYNDTYNKMDMNMNIDTYDPPQVVQSVLSPEYLDSETTSPISLTSPREIHPELENFIYQEALRYQEELRAKRVAEYERRKAKKVAQAKVPKDLVGLVYLWVPQNYDDPLHRGEFNLGFYIAPKYRKMEHIKVIDALNATIKHAFEDKQCHRLQSIVVENVDMLYGIELLSTCGFHREGVRRQAFFSPSAQSRKDMIYFAMLATEWVHDNDPTSSARLRASSLWDEVLTRHQQECDDLVRLQEKTLKRTHSTQTIRQEANVGLQSTSSVSYVTADESSASVSLNPEPSPTRRKKLALGSAAQARQSQSQGSNPSTTNSSDYTSGAPAESSRSPPSPRTRYETSIPSSSSSSPNTNKSRARKSVGSMSFSGSSDASDLSSQWVLLDDDIYNPRPS